MRFSLVPRTDHKLPALFLQTLLLFEPGRFDSAPPRALRLSVRELPLEAGLYDAFTLVVPAKTLVELARISAEEEEFVSLILPNERSQVLFHMNALLSRIDGASSSLLLVSG